MSALRLPFHGMPPAQLLVSLYSTLILNLIARTLRATAVTWHKNCISIGGQLVQTLWKLFLSGEGPLSERIIATQSNSKPSFSLMTSNLDITLS